MILGGMVHLEMMWLELDNIGWNYYRMEMIYVGTSMREVMRGHLVQGCWGLLGKAMDGLGFGIGVLDFMVYVLFRGWTSTTWFCL